ncbi:bifunctional diguanylate cyclase/phosphodiesterase [Salinicola aestuarinus]|uniref:bifunctional diguanylate cyclase/phosphodiesterase n=1 Tax=Salinicola aestuarinus TaxID=1949082 RepID=UPI000DA10B50|nr:EAL domain-containing protein [Salinicola aestuarinus]
MIGREQPYRLSLKWRAFVLTSLVLVALAASIAWISYANLTSQFDARQRAGQENQRQLLASALESSAKELSQLAAIIAASESLEEALGDGDPETVAQALQTQWPTLQLNAGIEEMQIFDVDGERLARYGSEQIESANAGWQQWVANIIDSERPDARTVCLTSCRQYVAVPILVAGGSAGVLVASRSLVDVLDYFQRSSGNDIALLTRDTRAQNAPQGASRRGEALNVMPANRTIPAWNAQALALTHQGDVLPLLAELAERRSLEALVGSPARIERDERDFEAIAMPLEGNQRANLNRQGFFVSLEDVTRQLGAIKRTIRMVLLASLVGWLVAETLLLSILWRPVRRIRLLSRYLPGLASGDFERFRDRIARSSRQPARDEIDVLADTTVELSYQLEALEQEVTARGKVLERQVSELERERDLVSALMDSAEALVVVHDAEDRVLLANRHALRMIGVESLDGESFRQYFLEREASVLEVVSCDGQRESDLITGDGQRRAIAWYHSRLKAWSDEVPAVVSVGIDITERKTAEMRLAWLAHRDPLTELYNRRYFEETLAGAVVSGAQGAMLYLDLDRFREVNELGGHSMGDQLLMRVAEVFRRQLGQMGTVARLGGDEFAVLMERAEADQAVILAQKIVAALTEVTLEVEGQRYRAAASIGIALYPDHGGTPKELMASADFAMYRAKANAEQRWHLLTSRVDRHALQERMVWEEKIRKALAEDGFQLWQQPIMRLADQVVTHHEVLLRLPDPVTGEIASPGWFISIAESSGQIVALDRWVLRQTLLHMRRVGDDSRFAVNLSGQSLRDEKLTEFLRNELDAHGIDARRLILEITETAAVTDFSTARYILQGLRSLGCRVALDDFGVGFSSFYYLDQLPADYIKIDGSFIQDLPENRRSQMIVKAIVEIARGLGKSTVAEFVDRAEIVDMLRTYGVNYAQGYWIGRPAPIDASRESTGPVR